MNLISFEHVLVALGLLVIAITVALFVLLGRSV